MKKFITNYQYRFIILLPLVASILSIEHTLAFGLTIILWLVILIPITGSLLLTQLGINRRLSFGEWLGYTTGLSIAFLMSFGLIVNIIGLISHYPTLRTNILVPGFDAIFLVLLGAMVLRKRSLPFPKYTDQKRSWRYHIFIHFPILFPLLSLAGVIRLNNNGTDLFALINIIVLIVYETVVFVSHKKLSEYAYVLNLVCAALSLVWSISMRSNHLIGVDIHSEFQIFNAVAVAGLCHPHLFNSVYNACLSITILPTVLKAFIPFSAQYVFKFLMQIILYIVPACVFVIAKRQLGGKNDKLAFFAALFFVVQSQFITEFPALIRQQSALLFFALLFFVISAKELSKTTQKILTLIFGFSMIVSHYSSGYVGLALLLLFAVLQPIWFGLTKKVSKRSQAPNQYWNVPGMLVVVLFLFSFLWYAEILQSTGGIVQKLSQSVTNFGSIFSSDSRSSFVDSTFGVGNLSYGTQTLQQLESQRKISGGYIQSSYKSYIPVPLNPASPQINGNLENNEYELFNRIIPLVVKIVMIIGALYMLLLSLKGDIDIENGLLVIIGGSLFLLLILLPVISQDYNLERLYQQLLVVLSVAIVLGAQAFSLRLKKIFLPLILIVVLGYLICNSGLANQLAFRVSNVNLDNGGATYDGTYTTNGEVDSLLWLSSRSSNLQSPINFDRYSILNAAAYTDIPGYQLRQGSFPSQFLINGYVYASSTNFNKGLTYDIDGNLVIAYNYPTAFLNDNKNIIYSDKDSAIFK